MDTNTNVPNNSVQTVIVKKKTPWYVWSCSGCLGLIVLCVIIGVIAGSGASKTSQKVGTASDTSASAQNASQTYYLNDQVKLDDKILTVYSVGVYNSSDSFSKPEAGFKLIAVDVSLQNGGNQPISYNTLDFKLQDESNHITGTSFFDNKSPDFGSGDLQPGRTVRGFLTFKVLDTSKTYELILDTSFWGREQLIVKLIAKP